jgi:diapolycopene oxygenase
LIGKATRQEKKQRLQSTPEKREIQKPLLCGGSVNPGGGMPMVFLSGQQVKDKIVKEQQGK